MTSARLPLLLLGACALALGACNPQEPSTPGSSAAPAGPPSSSMPASDTVGDGGAEQAPDEALPAGGSNPVEPGGSSSPASPASFNHEDAGDLLAGSGSGYLDRTLWAPDICFPMTESAFANSQVWGAGGAHSPAGKFSQCDPINYILPWYDNFCEARAYTTPLCAAGAGHQGQDIRPATCEKAVHWAVAPEAGQITDIGTYTVTLTASASPHRVYRYLHMQMDQLAVHEGDLVMKGQHMGKVSNNFGQTPTTIHLHWEMRAGVIGTSTDGKQVVLHTFLPPYLSLVEAYQKKLNGIPCS